MALETSIILSRLRKYFGNELLAPAGRRMVLTPLAESLVQPVRSCLIQIQHTVASKAAFDPAASDRKFCLAVSDYVTAVLMPQAMQEVARKAPGIRFELVRLDENIEQKLEKGGIDSARISSVGYGDSRPVVSNATEAGRQKNRRVDIVLYSPEPAKNPSEQAMKPTEAVDSGYGVAGLEPDNQSTSAPAAVSEPPADSAKMNNSAAEPSSSIPDVNPAAGDQPAPAKPMDQPIAPSEK